MNKVVALITLTILYCGCYAQNNDTIKSHKFNPDNIFTGGSLGLQFGTYTLVNVSPIIGYRINKRFSSGLGFTYTYLNDKSVSPSYDMNIIGGNVFSRFLVTDNFFAHAEYERLHLKYPSNYVSEPNRNVTVDNIFVGGGYSERFSDNSAFLIMILYNLNDTPDSPYGSPWIYRAGVVFGL